ncbi:MAG: NFACT family protein [Anaerolineae bacterium]|nr:NFACT family protein [Anaerolineae bacterium]
MNFDVWTISALVDELHSRVVGGRVQDVLDLNEYAIGLEIYANRERHYLVLDASPQQPHIHLVPDKLRRGLPRPTQLGLLLRRYVEGGALVDVTQPPWERMLILHIESASGVSEIVVEAIERRANILLVQEGLILDCIRRVGPDENRVRVSLPGHDYVMPPPQRGKIAPGVVTLADVESLLEAGSGGQAWQALTPLFRSPSAVRRSASSMLAPKR